MSWFKTVLKEFKEFAFKGEAQQKRWMPPRCRARKFKTESPVRAVCNVIVVPKKLVNIVAD